MLLCEPQELNFTLSVTDDISGINYCYLYVHGPDEIDYSYPHVWSQNEELEQTLEGIITIPQFSEPGTWIVEQITCYDNLGNQIDYSMEELEELGFSLEFEVINDGGFDTEPPEVVDFQFTSEKVRIVISF